MKKAVFISILIVLTSLIDAQWKDQSTHRVLFITDGNIRLEVLDWGGKGEPILFIAGLGCSAHIFDEFAPQFIDHFQVYGMTRRGYGASSKPDSGYDIKARTQDVLMVIDSLKLHQVILIGHSIAGDELTKFASLHPERVIKLIYLDAAYDHTDMSSYNNVRPRKPPMTRKDSSSVQGLQYYYLNSYGYKITESDLKANNIFSQDGRFLRNSTTGASAILKGLEQPTYKLIPVPALAIYATPESIVDVVPYYAKLDSALRSVADAAFPKYMDWLRKQIEQFKKDVKFGTVIEIKGAKHGIFISNSTEVESEIRNFLQKK